MLYDLPDCYQHHHRLFSLLVVIPQANKSPGILRLVWKYHGQCRNSHLAVWYRSRYEQQFMSDSSFLDPMVRFRCGSAELCTLELFNCIDVVRFMPADALWTFAMAFNVYLTFFRKYNSDQLRRLEWKYIVLCYGLPLMPAFTYFFIKSPSRGKIYGSAIVCSLLYRL